MALTNFNMPSNTDGGAIGVVVTATLFGRDVAISQTNLRRAGFVAPCALIPLSISYNNTARVATAQVKLRNVTDSTDVFANVTVASAAGTPSTTVVATNALVEKGDVLEMQATTDGTGTITDLQAYFTYLTAGAPDNRTLL